MVEKIWERYRCNTPGKFALEQTSYGMTAKGNYKSTRSYNAKNTKDKNIESISLVVFEVKRKSFWPTKLWMDKVVSFYH